MSVRDVSLKREVGYEITEAQVCGFGYYVHVQSGYPVIRWPAAIGWRAGEKSFPPNSGWRSGLAWAGAEWNTAPGGFSFGIANWGETSVARGNEEDEVWFSTDQSVLKGAPARCYFFMDSSGGRLWLVEADIVFDAGVWWSPLASLYDKVGYGGLNRPFVTTAMHEMGHAMGLAHENRTYNLMGQDFTHLTANSATIRAGAGEDATQGELFLYGIKPWIQSNDLGVSHWKYGGADGEYSEHTPTVIYVDLKGTVAYWETSMGFRRYHLRAGQACIVEFTFENNGINPYTVDVGYYISTNDTITTYDRRISTRSFAVYADWPRSVLQAVILPTDLKAGQTYYLGVIVDYTNKIPEYDEQNNATFLPIKIIP
jgi:hypothetical protein